MTILELYEYARERNILNYNIKVQHDSTGDYEGTRSIQPEEIEPNDDWEEIVL